MAPITQYVSKQVIVPVIIKILLTNGLFLTLTTSEKGALTGSSHLFERYIRSLQRAEAQCPLCHRGFDGQTEVDELVQEVMKMMGLRVLQFT